MFTDKLHYLEKVPLKSETHCKIFDIEFSKKKYLENTSVGDIFTVKP